MDNKVSLINLHTRLPKDVRKLIYAKLDKYDIELVLRAHGSKRPILTVKFSHYCAKNGYLDLLIWAISNGCQQDAYTCTLAAAGGHLEVLIWLHDNGCPCESRIYKRAAFNGHLEVLKWLYDNGCPINKSECIEYIKPYINRQNIVDWLNTI